MPLNDTKPVASPTACGCGIMNVPLFYKVAAGETKTITVPLTARKMTVHCLGTAGATAGAEIVLVRDGMVQGNSFALGGGSTVSFDIGGLNDRAGVYPPDVRIIATNITSVSFESEVPESVVAV